MDESKQTAKKYDKHGKEYHDYRKSKTNFYNSMIDIPAVLGLLKDIKGKKIIDIGCGSGIYSEILQKKGAEVVGIDISKTLIEIAKSEVKKVEFRVANIKELPFKNNSFDIAVSALMLGYLENWDRAFSEVKRILKPGGVFIFSILNPIYECKEETMVNGEKYKIIGISKDHTKVLGDYFKERWIETTIIKKMKIKSHHKTYETIIDTILRNGFSIEGYKDAKPIAKGKKISVIDYRTFSKLPIFCVFKIKKK